MEQILAIVLFVGKLSIVVFLFNGMTCFSFLKANDARSAMPVGNKFLTCYSGIKRMIGDSAAKVKSVFMRGVKFIAAHPCITAGVIALIFTASCYPVYKKLSKSQSDHAFNGQSNLSPEDKFRSVLQHIIVVNKSNTDVHLDAATVKAGQQVLVVGDIHGNTDALKNILDDMTRCGHMSSDGTLKKDKRLIFLGDNSSRGDGIGVWSMLGQLVQKNPNRVTLVRGNMDTALESEVASKGWRMKSDVNRMLDSLPHGMLLGAANKARSDVNWLLCCHGGIDPTSSLRDQLQKLSSYYSSSTSKDRQLPTVEFKGLNRDNGFNWTDFYGNKPTIDSSSSPKNVVSLAAAQTYMRNQDCQSNGVFSRLVAIIRGHQHVHGVSQLQPDGDYRTSFARISGAQSVADRAVYTTIASDKIGPKDTALKAYLELTPNAQGQWQLVPHILKK